MLIFIRFFIFAGPPQDKRDYQSHIRQLRQAKLLPDEEATSSTILEKTYYNVNSHPPESLAWFTVLIAQAVAHLRDDAKQYDNLLNAISKALNSDKIPSYVGKIDVTELNIGNNFPIFSNCRVITREENNEFKENNNQINEKKKDINGGYSINGKGSCDQSSSKPETGQLPTGSNHGYNHLNSKKNRKGKFGNINNDLRDNDMLLELLLDVDLSDHITLGIDTQLVINFPRPSFAILPVSLIVSIVNFSGTLKIALHQQETFSQESDTEDIEQKNSKFSQKTQEYTGPSTKTDESDNLHKLSSDSNKPVESDATKTELDATQDSNDETPNFKKKNRPYITISFDQYPTIEFDIRSSIGSVSKLKDIPKIAQLVETQLKKAVRNNLVYPYERQIFLPEIWPDPVDLTSSLEKNKSSNAVLKPFTGSSNYQGSSINTGNSNSLSQDREESTTGTSYGISSSTHTNGSTIPVQDQETIHFTTPRLHPRSFSSVSQLASNTATTLPYFRTISPEQQQDDHSAII